MLRDRNGQLQEFLRTTIPRANCSPPTSPSFPNYLEDERVEARAEIDLLTRNIEHIKDIVAMQQTYARVSGLSEVLPRRGSLIEDALQLNMDSFTRHRITVERDFANVPEVTVDKHKALQILVNLLRNAKHAMDDADGERKAPHPADSPAGRIDCRPFGHRHRRAASPRKTSRAFSHTASPRAGTATVSGCTAPPSPRSRWVADSLLIAMVPGRGATFIFELPLATPHSSS